MRGFLSCPKHIQRSPFEGIGKPQALKHHLKGCWSRRITDAHGLIYQINTEGKVEIVSFKGHYGN
ncbi:MAG: Txe/YoeB family addiction module toxin [Bacteroidetes bacterium]|nr:MAG: Txe/YoeB family addiction module toxin [Bacteroidota bacterium]